MARNMTLSSMHKMQVEQCNPVRGRGILVERNANRRATKTATAGAEAKPRAPMRFACEAQWSRCTWQGAGFGIAFAAFETGRRGQLSIAPLLWVNDR